MDAHKKDLAKVVTQEHGKTLADAEGSITRGIEVIEFATGIPHLLKGEFSDNVGHGRRQLLAAPAGGRVRGHHAVQFPGDGADVDVSGRAGVRQHIRAEAVRARSDAVAAHGRTAAGSGSSGRRIQRRPRRQGSGRRDTRASRRRAVSFVGSTPIARYIYETGARHGKRVQALGGAKNHAVVLPDADSLSRPKRSSARATDRPASAAWRYPRSSRSATWAIRCVEQLAERARRVTVGPGDAAGDRDGAGRHLRGRDRIVGFIDRGVAEGATAGRRRPQAQRRRDHETASSSVPRSSTDVTPAMAIYRNEIFGPVLCDRACRVAERRRSR